MTCRQWVALRIEGRVHKAKGQRPTIQAEKTHMNQGLEREELTVWGGGLLGRVLNAWPPSQRTPHHTEHPCAERQEMLIREKNLSV